MDSTLNEARPDPGAGVEQCAAEARVIRRVLAGQRDEFRELVLLHEQRVFAMVMRMVGDRAIAAELTQEAFLKAYLNLASFRFHARFSTWLIRIALNVTNSYFSSRRYKEQMKTTSLTPHFAAAAVAPGAETQQREAAIARIQKCIGKLKPIYRDVVVLCSLEEKSYEEAATILGIPLGTVCSRMNKAFELLRLCYKRAEA